MEQPRSVLASMEMAMTAKQLPEEEEEEEEFSVTLYQDLFKR
jgi:hypothetical protein